MRARIRLFLRLSLAHARRHRARTGLTVGGVALGVAAVTAVLALSRSITTAFEQTIVRGAGAAQLQVSNGSAGVDRDLIDALAKTRGIVATGATVEHRVAVPELGLRLTILGVELGRDEAYRELQMGPDVADIPDGLGFIAKTDSIALPPAVLAAHGLGLGDVVTLNGAKGSHRMIVRGTLRDGGVLAAYAGAVGLMDLDAAQLRFGDPTKVHWIDLVVGADRAIEDVEAELVTRLGDQAVVEPPAMRGRRIERIMSLLRGLLASTSVVAMLVGIFLIHHALATSYRQRRPDFVRLRQLGVSRRGVVGYVLVEAAVLGSLASALGLGLGLAFWRLAVRDFSHAIAEFTFPLPPITLALTARELGGAVLLGTFAVMTGAMGPAIAMLRTRPNDADVGPVRSRAVAVSALAIAGVVLAVASVLVAQLAHGLGFTGQLLVITGSAACVFLAAPLIVPLALVAVEPVVAGARGDVRALQRRWMWRQVWRHRLHTATTTGALAAGVAYAVALTMVLTSYRTSLTEWIAQMFDGDVVVSAGPNLSLLGGQTLERRVLDEIRSIEGVARVRPWRLLEARFRGQPIVVQAVPDEAFGWIARGIDLGADEVLVSDSFAEHFTVAEGDRITIPAPARSLSVRVAGIVPDYVLHLGTVKMPWPTYTAHFGDDRFSFAFVDVDAAADSAAVKRRIDERFTTHYDLATLLIRDLRALLEQLTDQSLAMLSWLQLLAALVAIAAMVSATAAAVIDRDVELRTWRALGLRRRDLVRLLAVEAAFVGGIGGVLGLGSGMLLGGLLTTSLATALAGYRLPLQWPLVTMIAVPVVSTLAASAAAAVVARRWTRGPQSAGSAMPLRTMTGVRGA